MKKSILLFLISLMFQIAAAQQLVTEDFSAFTIGNIGTDLTGVTPGQNGYFTTATNGIIPTTTTNTDNSNFQIISLPDSHGQVLQITGPNGDKGNRFMWKNGLDAAWASRVPGNDIIQVEYDFYTGDATPSKNNMRLVVYDATKTKVLTGFSYNAETGILSGVGYYDATSEGGIIANYFFYLGEPVGTTPTDIVLSPNTWVRIGMSYNYNTGVMIFRGNGFNKTITGSASLTNPDQLDVVCSSGTNTGPSNTAFAVSLYDNIIAIGSATDTLLSVNKVSPDVQFSVYPNPVTGTLIIRNNSEMDSIQITDLNGRIVKTANLDNSLEIQVNISDLSPGIYLVNVNTKAGKAIKKIIKN